MQRVFVYGTLKKGYGNHHVLGDDAVFVGDAVTCRRYRMITVGYPVILEDGDGYQVKGEVYEVSDETVPDLDRLESEGRSYDRKLEEVTLTSGGLLLADIYVGRNEVWGHHRFKFSQLNPDGDGELTWPAYEAEQDDSYDYDDEPEFVEPEDQSQGDLFGYDNEREHS